MTSLLSLAAYTVRRKTLWAPEIAASAAKVKPAHELDRLQPIAGPRTRPYPFVGRSRSELDRLFSIGVVTKKGTERSAAIERFFASFKLTGPPKP